MGSPLVTVIIPAYNCAGFISNAVKSVLSQTYPDVELIVVDDGSKDDTAGVLQPFKQHLTYVHQENGGVSKARNTGMRSASGEYIAFLDADDVWDRSKLEIQVKVMEENRDIGFLFSDFQQMKDQEIFPDRTYETAFNVFREYGCRIEDFFEKKGGVIVKGISVDYYYGDVYRHLFLGNFILPSSVLFRRSLIDKVGYLNEEYRVAEETEYFLRLSRHAMAGFVKQPLLYYEMPASGNLSGKSNTERLMKNALKIQIDSLVNNFRLSEKKEISHYIKALSVTYCRLAYYYLSERRVEEARRYAAHGIKTDRTNGKAYRIYVAGMLPQQILEGMARAKRRLGSQRRDAERGA